MNVAPHAGPIDDLAQQQRPAVAELRHEIAELVAGVGHGQRVGAGRRAIAGQRLQTFVRGQRRRVQSQRLGQSFVEPDQRRAGHRHRLHAGVENVRQARVAVVEVNSLERRLSG